MKYIYIAGPYSNGDPVLNVRLAIQTAERLVARGFIPFIPHLTMFWHLLLPHYINYWYEYDLAWLDKCDGLLRLPGKSKGLIKKSRSLRKKEYQYIMMYLMLVGVMRNNVHFLA